MFSGRVRLQWLPKDDAGFNNFPTELLGGLKSVIDATPIGTAITEIDVADIFDAASQGKAGKALATVSLGVGLAAVGTAIPVVGQIGAALAALAAGIVRIIKSQKAKQDRNDAAVREAMYRSFPPLQTADSVTDSGLVQNQVRTILQTQDWTPLFMPRFKGEWVGIERDKGRHAGQNACGGASWNGATELGGAQVSRVRPQPFH
jgi:hypothetical protein